MSRFSRWLLANLDPEDIRCLDLYGAAWGCPGMIYTRDINALYDQFRDELWTLLWRHAFDLGVAPLELAATVHQDSGYTTSLGNHDDLARALVWHGAVRVAESLAPGLQAAS